MRQAELLSAENELLQSIIRIYHKSAYPYRYTPKNTRLPRSIGSFSSFQHRLKLLPTANMVHIRPK
jgi:hypothetical protein